jgi:hypothetical protein
MLNLVKCFKLLVTHLLLMEQGHIQLASFSMPKDMSSVH